MARVDTASLIGDVATLANEHADDDGALGDAARRILKAFELTATAAETADTLRYFGVKH